MRLRKRFWGLATFALLMTVMACTKGDFEPIPGATLRGEPVGRQPVLQARHVLVMVSGGHNSLASYLSDDQLDIAAGYVPEGTGAYTDALVIFSRLPKSDPNSTTSAPVLYRMYKDKNGSVVRDTLRRFTEEDRLFGGDVFREALMTVRDRLPARDYGMIVSSHASGWLPPGYYNNPQDYENGRSGFSLRSIGQDLDNSVSVEMDLEAFASAIPYKMNYVILDCCLSGGIEVAWQLRGKTDLVAFTQTETMADGFDYRTIMSRLLFEPVPNPQGVCEDFYNYYMAKRGVNRSATISLVDTRRLDNLSEVCGNLFSLYRSQISTLSDRNVQRYFRYERHYFYDLRDILVEAGITPEETAALDAALQECVLYKAATPYFMEGTQYGFEITDYCGLSMYLPSKGTDFLNNYYRNHIAWNQATHLVL